MQDLQQFTVTTAETGRVTIECPAVVAAILCGREQFGDVKAMQLELCGKLADSWYAADCPPDADVLAPPDPDALLAELRAMVERLEAQR
jgi:hypothetical protein